MTVGTRFFALRHIPDNGVGAEDGFATLAAAEIAEIIVFPAAASGLEHDHAVRAELFGAPSNGGHHQIFVPGLCVARDQGNDFEGPQHVGFAGKDLEVGFDVAVFDEETSVAIRGLEPFDAIDRE